MTRPARAEQESQVPDPGAAGPAAGAPRPPAATILALQHSAGNWAVQRMIGARGQTKVARQPPTSPAAAADPAPAAPGPGPASPGANGTAGLKVIAPPDAKGPLIRHGPTSVDFTDDPDFVKFKLEEYVEKNGLDSVNRFDEGLFLPAPPTLTTTQLPQQAPDDEYTKRVMKTVHEQVVALRAHISQFRDDFQGRANDTLATILEQSRKRLEVQREKFGIKSEKTTVFGKTVWTSHSGADNDISKWMADDAKTLLAKQPAVVRADWDLKHSHEKSERDTARAQLTTAQREYGELRQKFESQYPMTMAFNLDPLGPETQGHLMKLSSGDAKDRAEDIGSEIDTRLANIDKVQKTATDDRTYVWSLERIVNVTRELPDIKQHKLLTHRGLQGSVAIEKHAEVKVTEELLSAGIGIVLFGLGLIAAAPTGGMSMAGAAAVSAAGVAEAVLTIAAADRAARKYDLESAAAGTDYDKAQAISAEQPELLWLALDILGAAAATAGGAKAAASLFKSVSALREEALTAKAMAEASKAQGLEGASKRLDVALGKLESEGEAASAGAGKRLRREVESGPADGRTRRSGAAVDPDAPPAPMKNPLPSVANMGPEGKGMTRSEAVGQYFTEIQANPEREYAIIQNKENKRFAVLTGGADKVDIPLHFGDDWAFVRHYHPIEGAHEAAAFKLGADVPLDTKQALFGARMPSVFGPNGSHGDILGSRMQSLKTGENVSETLDWFDPIANRMRTTRFGVNWKDPAGVYWVEIPYGDAMLKRKFRQPKDVQLWIWSLEPPPAPKK